MGKCHGDPHSLPLATGKFSDVAVGKIAHLGPIEGVLHRALVSIAPLAQHTLVRIAAPPHKILHHNAIWSDGILWKESEPAGDGLADIAEAENARRRAEDEVSKARKFGVESFAESMLAVCDSLDAALAIENATVAQLREGSDATRRQLLSALERNKVIVVAPAPGTKFDPHQHQAISMVPADQEPNTVVSVLQKGYLIAERVLRPALVTVAAPK